VTSGNLSLAYQRLAFAFFLPVIDHLSGLVRIHASLSVIQIWLPVPVFIVPRASFARPERSRKEGAGATADDLIDGPGRRWWAARGSEQKRPSSAFAYDRKNARFLINRGGGLRPHWRRLRAGRPFVVAVVVLQRQRRFSAGA